MLISWFKENFKTSEYQKYLRKIKAPLLETHKGNEMVGDSPAYESNLIKTEKMKSDFRKEAKCNTCGEVGHNANQCD